MLNEPGVDLTQVFTSLIAPGIAQDAYRRGDYAKAARGFEEAARALPQGQMSAAYYGLAARSWVRCRKNERAVRVLEVAHRIDSRPKPIDRLPSLMVFDLGLQGDQGLVQRILEGPSLIPREEEARLAFEVVMEAGHPDLGPRATVNLGVRTYQQGDVAAARKLFELARNGTSRAARVQAIYNLGAVAEGLGERARARRYYWRAVWSRGDRTFSRRALRQLFAGM